jgi:photosystem II stability/assembly factor-like uncharacterized protein
VPSPEHRTNTGNPDRSPLRFLAVRPRGVSLAVAAIGLSVLVIVLAACGGPARLATGTSTSESTNFMTTCARPPVTLAGLEILSWSFATTQDGWALGTTTTAVMGCTVVAHTTDGGRSWHLAGSPQAEASGQQCPTCLWGLRFASTSIGYAFGGEFFVTTDGGARWQRQSTPPVVLLEASDGIVVRVVSPCGATNQCARTVQETTAGSSSWHTLNAPVDSWGQVVLVGRSTIYLLGANSGLWRSTDSGDHWSHLSSPCALLPTHDPAFSPRGQPGVMVQVAATGSAVAAICISDQIGPQSAGYQQDVALSGDQGSSFGPVHAVPQLAGPDHSSGIRNIALPTPSSVVVVGSEGGVQTSLDGGATWTTTMPQPAATGAWCPEPLGFESASVGHAVYPANTMLNTTDGGRRWTPFTFS